MKFDVIRAVEACYAHPLDDRAWLDGVLETLAPLDDGPGFAAIVRDGSRTHAPSATSNPNVMLEMDEELGRFRAALPPGAYWPFEAPSPPVDFALKRASRFGPRFVEFWRALLRRHCLEDSLAIFGKGDEGKTLLIVTATPVGRPFLSARTLHQLTLFSAHLSSGLRLRHAVSGFPADEVLPEAVLDPAGRVVHAAEGAEPNAARQSLAAAVRSMDRARGALRRTDPDEALRLWRGLVDGTWSVVDRCDSDGKRYVLARRNEPGVRDPKVLTQRERSVAAFAAMGHQNKYIGYMLGLSSSTVSSHLESVRRKLRLGSRAELVQWFAPAAQAAACTSPSALARSSSRV